MNLNSFLSSFKHCSFNCSIDWRNKWLVNISWRNSTLDEQIFNLNTKLNIAIAKCDYIIDDLSFSYESRIINPFSNKFKTRLKSLEFTEIAARSKNQRIKQGKGLCELIKEWDSLNINDSNIVTDKSMNYQKPFHYFTFPKI